MGGEIRDIRRFHEFVFKQIHSPIILKKAPALSLGLGFFIVQIDFLLNYIRVKIFFEKRMKIKY
jgi:hypothetical protein